MFEYKTTSVFEQGDFDHLPTRLEKTIQTLGDQGWEVVTVSYCNPGQFTENHYFVVVAKRQRR